MFFMLIALINVADIASRFIRLPELTTQVILTALSLLCLIYVAYVELKNKWVFMGVVMASIGAGIVLQLASQTVQAVALILPVVALALHMLIQAKESTGQFIALLRLLLLALSVLSVGWAIYIEYVLQAEIGESLPYIFSTALLLTILALTSFLTPIHTKDAVKRTVY